MTYISYLGLFFDLHIILSIYINLYQIFSHLAIHCDDVRVRPDNRQAQNPWYVYSSEYSSDRRRRSRQQPNPEVQRRPQVRAGTPQNPAAGPDQLSIRAGYQHANMAVVFLFTQ